MRSLIRTVASILGVIALTSTAYVLHRYGLANPERDRFHEGVTASAAVRSEVGRDCDLRVELAPESDEAVVVTVSFRDVPDDPATRKELIRGTNMAVRRNVHHVKDLKILFDERPEPLPSWDGGVAVAGTPVPVGAEPSKPRAQTDAGSNAPQPAPAPTAPRTGKKGTITVVTFPEADVFSGGKKLGHTPLFDVELPVGTHLLTLVGADGASHRLSMPVKVGKNKPLKLKLSDLPSK